MLCEKTKSLGNLPKATQLVRGIAGVRLELLSPDHTASKKKQLVMMWALNRYPRWDGRQTAGRMQGREASLTILEKTGGCRPESQAKVLAEVEPSSLTSQPWPRSKERVVPPSFSSASCGHGWQGPGCRPVMFGFLQPRLNPLCTGSRSQGPRLGWEAHPLCCLGRVPRPFMGSESC